MDEIISSSCRLHKFLFHSWRSRLICCEHSQQSHRSPFTWRPQFLNSIRWLLVMASSVLLTHCEPYIAQGDPYFCVYIQYMITMSVNVFSRKVLCAKFCHLVVDFTLQRWVSHPPCPEFSSELRWPADPNMDTLSICFFGGLLESSPCNKTRCRMGWKY